MKQQVLKALANPPLLFYVPYTLAVLNFVVQFVVFFVFYIILLFIIPDKVNDYLSPLYLLISVCVVHMFLARLTKTDPQFGQVLIAKIRLIGSKIPRRLPA